MYSHLDWALLSPEKQKGFSEKSNNALIISCRLQGKIIKGNEKMH